MSQTVKRYSEAFKRHVVREYEDGATIEELRRKYGIGGGSTIQQWIRKYGREGLRHRVMRIQTAEEADQVPKLQQEIARLQEALAQTLMEKMALEKTLALYQKAFGTDLAKKNAPGSSMPSTMRPTNGDWR